MAFNDAGYVDARQSTFIRAGRDQTMIHNHYHIYISPYGDSRLRPRIGIDISDNLSLPIGSPETLPQGSFVPYCSYDAVPIVGGAIALIDQITELLMDCRQSSSGRRDLVLELESLRKTLVLTRLTIRKYDNRPLGQSLAKTITPEVLRCSFILQELLDSVDGAWLDFSITTVGGLWRRFWWAILGGDELASVREKLCYSWQSLQGLLMALCSCVLLRLNLCLR
jgi:hypothetical protein